MHIHRPKSNMVETNNYSIIRLNPSTPINLILLKASQGENSTWLNGIQAKTQGKTLTWPNGLPLKPKLSTKSLYE
jgi:hypothetical protein